MTIAAITATAAGWLYLDGADDRERKRLNASYDAKMKRREEERAKQAYIEPKEYWTLEELREYDGTKDPDGPILIAADGKVYNVYKVSEWLLLRL